MRLPCSGHDGFVGNYGEVRTFMGTSSLSGKRGLEYTGDRGTLVNAGSVSTSPEPFSHGLMVKGDDGTISNFGVVETAGDSSYGLYHLGASGTVTNGGKVITAAAAADAIRLEGTTGLASNTGTLTATGAGANGISVIGTAGTVINSGSISSTSGRSVYLEGTNSTLSLGAGSILIGAVEFTDPATSKLTFGPGLNAVVKTTDLIGLTITAPRNSYAVVGDTVYVSDTTSSAANDGTAAFSSGLILNALERRATTRPGNAIATLSTRSAPEGHRWGQFFAGGLKKNGNATEASYSASAGGFVLGHESDPDDGVYGGLSFGRTKDANGSAFNIVSTGIFIGKYWLHGNSEIAVSASISNHKSERFISGLGGRETANARFGSFYISPSIKLSGVLGQPNSSLRLRYLALHTLGYSETGSSANMTVGSRTSHFAEARVTLRAPITQHVGFRYGFDAQYTSAKVGKVTLAGTALALPNASDGLSGRGFIALDLVGIGKNGKKANGMIDIGLSSSNQIDVSLSIIARF